MQRAEGEHLVGEGPGECFTPLPTHESALLILLSIPFGTLPWEDLSRSFRPASHFPNWGLEEQAQKGKELTSGSQRPQEDAYMPAYLFHFPPLLLVPPPLQQSWGCSRFSLPFPILPLALPRPACRLTSPLLCSPIAASPWLSSPRPLEPGEAPHLLSGQCFLLSPPLLPNLLPRLLPGQDKLAPSPPPTFLSGEGVKNSRETPCWNPSLASWVV